MAARLTGYLVVGIVCVTLIAGLIVGAQRDDDGPVDLIVHNAVVFTGDVTAPDDMPQAVAVRANQILKVGSNREILRLQRPQTRTIDAQGATVLPGFNDAHLHLIRGGLSLNSVDLRGAETVKDATERVRQWAEAHPDRPWIVGRGWDEELLDAPDRPTRQALDKVVKDRPVQLVSEDGSYTWVNSAALKKANISDPVGILEGPPADAVEALLPEPTAEQRQRALFAAIAEAQRLGITSVQNFDGAPGDFALIDAAKKGGRSVGIRLYAALPVDDARTDEDVAALDDVLARYPDDPFIKGGAATVDVDGIAADPLNKLVRLLDARGWQVMIEADSADEAAMARAAFEHAERSNGRPERQRRHRLEHQDRHFTLVGGKLALGSDWPNAPLEPMTVLENAAPFLTLPQALQAYTVNSAYASYDEGRKGFIKPGMLADIVVLSADVFALEPAQLSTVKVAYTIFDGKIVYPASTLTRFTN